MKDAFDVVADVISLINVPAVKSQITGTVSADERGSADKSDIVVNCFGVSNLWNQGSTPNVNLYVPELASGKKDSITMRRIVKAVLPLLDNQHRSTFQTSVEDGGNWIQDPDGKWFYNITVNYMSIQEKYKNV